MKELDERVDFRMTSAVPETVQSILKDTLHPEAFQKTNEGKQKKKHGSKYNSNKKHKLLPTQVPVAMPTMFTHFQVANAISLLQTPMVSIPSGFPNQGQNVQYMAIPAGQLPPFSYSDFS